MLFFAADHDVVPLAKTADRKKCVGWRFYILNDATAHMAKAVCPAVTHE